jgi:hypothetical protein
VKFGLEYIDDWKDFYNVLIVSKEWNSKLSKLVHKKLLSGVKEPTPHQRKILYSNLLEVVRYLLTLGQVFYQVPGSPSRDF